MTHTHDLRDGRRGELLVGQSPLDAGMTYSAVKHLDGEHGKAEGAFVSHNAVHCHCHINGKCTYKHASRELIKTTRIQAASF